MLFNPWFHLGVFIIALIMVLVGYVHDRVTNAQIQLPMALVPAVALFFFACGEAMVWMIYGVDTFFHWWWGL